jgi:hypothetical protein
MGEKQTKTKSRLILGKIPDGAPTVRSPGTYIIMDENRVAREVKSFREEGERVAGPSAPFRVPCFRGSFAKDDGTDRPEIAR